MSNPSNHGSIGDDHEFEDAVNALPSIILSPPEAWRPSTTSDLNTMGPQQATTEHQAEENEASPSVSFPPPTRNEDFQQSDQLLLSMDADVPPSPPSDYDDAMVIDLPRPCVSFEDDAMQGTEGGAEQQHPPMFILGGALPYDDGARTLTTATASPGHGTVSPLQLTWRHLPSPQPPSPLTPQRPSNLDLFYNNRDIEMVHIGDLDDEDLQALQGEGWQAHQLALDPSPTPATRWFRGGRWLPGPQAQAAPAQDPPRRRAAPTPSQGVEAGPSTRRAPDQQVEAGPSTGRAPIQEAEDSDAETPSDPFAGQNLGGRPCQRCTIRRRGCTKGVRPCQRCRQAGLGAEDCVPSQKGANARPERKGRRQGPSGEGGRKRGRDGEDGEGPSQEGAEDDEAGGDEEPSPEEETGAAEDAGDPMEVDGEPSGEKEDEEEDAEDEDDDNISLPVYNSGDGVAAVSSRGIQVPVKKGPSGSGRKRVRFE